MVGFTVFNELLGSDLSGANIVEPECPDGVFQKVDFFTGRIDKHNGYRREYNLKRDSWKTASRSYIDQGCIRGDYRCRCQCIEKVIDGYFDGVGNCRQIDCLVPI